MADPLFQSNQTPEEVLESEIEDLEKRTLNSGWLWVAAAVGLIVLFSSAFLITNWDRQEVQARPFAVVPEAMVLTEPVGSVDRDLTFRWSRVDGAVSYILLVTATDRNEVEILRPVRETYLKPSETEFSNLNPGAFTWAVEARSAKGQLIGYGEASFSILGDN
jgi:hypothetical protein